MECYPFRWGRFCSAFCNRNAARSVGIYWLLVLDQLWVARILVSAASNQTGVLDSFCDVACLVTFVRGCSSSICDPSRRKFWALSVDRMVFCGISNLDMDAGYGQLF